MENDTAAFHRHYYDSLVWTETQWLGVPTQTCPLDLCIYQEILAETRPGLVVETGTAYGGSPLFLASVCDLLGHGLVVTIDSAEGERPQHPGVSYLHGSSTDAAIVERVRLAAGSTAVMVVLDSDHAADHVLAELETYAPLVTSGCYLIVEDTNVNGHPVVRKHGPGPAEAVENFLNGDDRFESTARARSS